MERFDIEPWTEELTPKLISKELKKNRDRFNYETAISADGYVFDGLYETNYMLIERGFILHDILTREEFQFDRTFDFQP